MLLRASSSFFFFFNDTATTEIYTLSLHDALPISHAAGDRDRTVVLRAHLREAARLVQRRHEQPVGAGQQAVLEAIGEHELDCHAIGRRGGDRKSTRLNSSHLVISYAVFCLKKKKTRIALLTIFVVSGSR